MCAGSQNQTMNDILLQVLADDKKLILYRKELNKITGSITATILLQQFIFHASQKKYESFYKFIEPCDHELYREGDSWTEELGFTKYEFNTAYKKLENLGIVTKKINMSRVTFYTLNRALLGKLIKSIYEEHITIPNSPSNSSSGDISPVNGQCQLRKSESINLDYSIIKEQRLLEEEEEEEEERHEKLNLDYLNDYIDETTNNRKTIKGNYTAYRAGVVEAILNPKNKRHKKTIESYRHFIQLKEDQVNRKEIEPHALERLNDILEINIKDFKNKKINGKYDIGIIQSIQQDSIDAYTVTYLGLGKYQSQKLLHNELFSGRELQSKSFDNK